MPASSPSRGSLVVFGNSWTVFSTVLVDALLRAARPRALAVVVCDAARRPASPRLRAAGTYVLASAVKRLFDPAHPIVLRRPLLVSLEGLARRARVPFTVPPRHDVNHPDFIAWLRGRPAPALAVAFGCTQIFERPLLEACERAVNYHNALLPAYRGLRATSWSVYNQEPETGFTFHEMTEGIDEGPTLLQGALPVRPGQSVLELEWEKTVLAAASVDRVLELVLGGEPAREQQGEPSYFGMREFRAIRSVGDPSCHTWAELERRIRAFGIVTMHLDGIAYEVTRIRRLATGEHGRPGLRFTTSDGVAAEPTRFGYLPLPLHRMHRRFGGRGR